MVKTSTVLLLIYIYSCVWATQSSFDTCGATILVPTSRQDIKIMSQTAGHMTKCTQMSLKFT